VRKLFALTLALVAGLFAAGTASASDYCHGNVTVVRGGYNAVRVVKVVKAAPYEAVEAVADDYSDAANVTIVRGGYNYGHNVTIVRGEYGHDVRGLNVGRGRNVRADNPNAGGGVLGILKAAAKTVGNVGRAVIGG
jgi:hypothetical protein